MTLRKIVDIAINNERGCNKVNENLTLNIGLILFNKVKKICNVKINTWTRKDRDVTNVIINNTKKRKVRLKKCD